MNKHFSLLIHSLLIVGALLPLSPLASVNQPAQPTASQNPLSKPAHASPEASQLLAFGSGAPQFRGGGGTR